MLFLVIQIQIMQHFSEFGFVATIIPIYAVVIGIEILLSSIQSRPVYTFKDTLTNIYQTTLNMGLDIAFRTFYLFVLGYAFQHAFVQIEYKILYWATLFVAEDFVFYCMHLLEHRSRLFWSVHFTHHSSSTYNLTTGFRSSVFQPMYRFIFFLPLAFLGFKALDILLMYSITQIYGILVHTQMVNKLGFLEHILITPSHHRVHHANNDRYLDKNMGMCLIVWDKLFGTFQAELPEEKVVYGLAHNDMNPNNPIDLVLHEPIKLGKIWMKELPLQDKFKYTFRAPGWSHDGSTKTAAELQKKYK